MTIADRKAREKEQRRTDIINAAEKLFFSRGYDGVSMEDIARQVELNRATLYLYFKNKESLYLAIVLRAVRQLDQITRERVLSNPDGFRRIDALGYSYLYFARVYPDYFKVYRDYRGGRLDSLDLDPGNPELLEIRKLQGEYVNRWFDAMKTGRSAGILKPGINPDCAALMMMTAIEGMASMSPVLKDALAARKIDPESFLRQFRAGIGFDGRKLLRSIRAPTLIVNGTRDEFVPMKITRELVSGIAGAKLILVEGGDHMFAVKSPDLLIDPVLDFLGNLDARQAVEPAKAVH